MRALVSGADVDAVLAARLDQVHDACRRLGASPDGAITAVEAAALGLIDALARQPETVGDLVGGLFARAHPLTPAQPGSSAAAADDPVERAFGQLDPVRRLVLLLRDGYATTAEQAAVALGVDVAGATEAVAAARVALVEAVDERMVTDRTGHEVSFSDLGMLADDTAPRGGRFAALRRHVSGCSRCAGVLAAQTRGRAMVAALPVLAMPEADREATLRQASMRALRALPSAAKVAAELDGRARPMRLVPVPLVLVLVLLAAGLGVLTGVLIGHSDHHSLGPAAGPGQPACSISATRNASSRDCPVFSRGSQAVS